MTKLPHATPPFFFYFLENLKLPLTSLSYVRMISRDLSVLTSRLFNGIEIGSDGQDGQDRQDGQDGQDGVVKSVARQ